MPLSPSAYLKRSIPFSFSLPLISASLSLWFSTCWRMRQLLFLFFHLLYVVFPRYSLNKYFAKVCWKFISIICIFYNLCGKLMHQNYVRNFYNNFYMKVRSKIILYQVGCKKLYVKIVCAVKVVFKNYPIKSWLEKIMGKSYAY